VVPVVLQLWLYLTPVIYPISMVPERFRSLYMLNPLAGLIDAYRQILVWGQIPNLSSLLPAVIISILIIIGAYIYFKWSEAEFADVI
jgi:lipopolysaccharide transport system permease protein